MKVLVTIESLGLSKEHIYYLGHDLQYNIGTFMLATHLIPGGYDQRTEGVLTALLSGVPQSSFTFMLNQGEKKEPIDLRFVTNPSELVT